MPMDWGLLPFRSAISLALAALGGWARPKWQARFVCVAGLAFLGTALYSLHRRRVPEVDALVEMSGRPVEVHEKSPRNPTLLFRLEGAADLLTYPHDWPEFQSVAGVLSNTAPVRVWIDSQARRGGGPLKVWRLESPEGVRVSFQQIARHEQGQRRWAFGAGLLGGVMFLGSLALLRQARRQRRAGSPGSWLDE